MVVAHNLNEARKARDGNRKSRTTKEPEKLKIGDNVLVRDHTSKTFQPKYKDFCIVGLPGKNQIEIKDNHGHITKVLIYEELQEEHLPQGVGVSLETKRSFQQNEVFIDHRKPYEK